MLAIFLDYGADVNQANVNGLTPLHNASCNGRVSSVKLLLERGADIFARNNQGLTAFQVAGAENKNHKKAVENMFHDLTKNK